MGRKKIYLTPEDKRIADCEKARRYYRRKHPIIQRVRQPLYSRETSETATDNEQK